MNHVSVLLLGSKCKTHALDLFVNRKRLFHVVSDNLATSTNLQHTVLDDVDDLVGIKMSNYRVDYIDYYKNTCANDFAALIKSVGAIIVICETMSELHRVFEDNPQIMDYILDDDSKTNIPPIPTIFVNVNHAIDEIGFIPFVARFQQERLFPTSFERRSGCIRDPICGRSRVYTILLTESLLTSVNVTEVFQIGFLMACYRNQLTSPKATLHYLRGTEARLRRLEKKRHFLICQEGCYNLLCIDQRSALLTFLIISKFKLHLCRDIVWHIFSFIPIYFNNGSYNNIWFRQLIDKFDLRVSQSKTLMRQHSSMEAQGQGFFQMSVNSLTHFNKNPTFFSPFTKRLLNHVYRSNEKMHGQKY